MHGWPSNENDCAELVRPYFTFKEEISSVDGLFFKGQRLIVPQSLRYKTLQVLHRSHMGVSKTLARARSAFFWPGVSAAIKDICLKCETCLKYSNKQRKESLGLVPSCTEAWDAVATDIFEFSGSQLPHCCLPFQWICSCKKNQGSHCSGNHFWLCLYIC